MDVKDLAGALADKMRNPFDHPDMNRNDIDWQSVYTAMRREIEEDDLPAALIDALTVISGDDPDA